MTRKEKIEHIAELTNINVAKQDITDYPLTDEELHKKTLTALEKLTDDELDMMIDKIWDVIKDIMDSTPLPESLNTENNLENEELINYLNELFDDDILMIQEALKWAEIDGGTNDSIVCHIMKTFLPNSTLDLLENYIEKEIGDRGLQNKTWM